jgi:arylsulfatase A
VARALREAGYATAVAGKWNQLEDFRTVEDGRAWGFDEFLIWRRNGGNDGGDRYWNPAYNRNGEPLKDAAGRYGPELLHEFVVEFIRRHRERPFFVYYPMVLVHAPILKTPDSSGAAEQFYADNIAYQDKLVGKLVEELDRLGLREKTLIVFTGDNGSAHGGGGRIGGRPIDGAKGSMKEGGSRVPLIANWQGTTPAGLVRQDLVDFSDFMPTLAELAGARLPEGVTIDGHSFAPALRGQPGSPREWVYVQLGAEHYARSARWKLNESGQLFDMRDAPFAQIPVPADRADADAAAGRRHLEAALASLGVAGSGVGLGTGQKGRKKATPAP